MSDNQSGTTASKPTKKGTPGRIVLIGAIGTSLAIINLLTNSEAPSQALAILQYTALALGLIALVGGLIMMATTPK